MNPSFLLALGMLAAQAAPGRDVVDELLDLPAPAADWAPRAPALKFSFDQPPAEDAPIDLLMAYWSDRYAGHRSRHGKPEPVPSPKVRARVFEKCLQDPSWLHSCLHLVPDAAEAHDRVKALLEAEERDRKLPYSDPWRKDIRSWLTLHSRFFRDDLVQLAEAAAFKEGWVQGQEELESLAQMDWARAAPVLEKHVAGKDPRLAALALSLQHRHAIEAKEADGAEILRQRLKAIARNPEAPGHARAFACDGLLTTDWPGRDDLFLSLFKDKTLQRMIDGNSLHSPRAHMVRRDPDKWIPIVSGLLGNADRAVHDAAVECLIQFHLDLARKDALEPLLPWLSNPEWSSTEDRLRLIQSLDRVNLPQSVPGLIWVVENSIEYELSGAAEALAVYKDKRAGPALMGALQGPSREFQRRSVVRALIACDGLSDDHIVSAVESYAVKVSTEKGREQVRATDDIIPKVQLDGEVSLGMHLSYLPHGNEKAAARLVSRAEALEKSKPDVARSLRAILEHWKFKVVDEFLARRLAVDQGAVTAALSRREEFRKNVDLPSKGGVVAGFAAVIFGDAARAKEILAGTDRDATRALLAAARLVRQPLAVAEVGKLLKSEDPKLLLAAERYLESEDSEPARKLVLERHPGEARILGARMSFDPGHLTYGEFGKWEDRLRTEIRGKDAPDEIIALLSAGYWGDAGQRIIRIRGDSAEASLQGKGDRTETKPLSVGELRRLRTFLQDERVDDLPPLGQEVHDGMQYEYVRLRKEGGRRVFMNNPSISSSAASVYDRLSRLLVSLSPSGK